MLGEGLLSGYSKGILDHLFISKTVFARIARVLIALMYTRRHQIGDTLFERSMRVVQNYQS